MTEKVYGELKGLADVPRYDNGMAISDEEDKKEWYRRNAPPPYGDVHYMGTGDPAKHVKPLYTGAPDILIQSGLESPKLEGVCESPLVSGTGNVTAGKKFDGGKPDLTLCPKAALEAMAEAFMYGEKKYGRNNYKQGLESHRLLAAAMRHLVDYKDVSTNDPESGRSHLGHALASIAMLLECERVGTLRDTITSGRGGK